MRNYTDDLGHEKILRLPSPLPLPPPPPLSCNPEHLPILVTGEGGRYALDHLELSRTGGVFSAVGTDGRCLVIHREKQPGPDVAPFLAPVSSICTVAGQSKARIRLGPGICFQDKAKPRIATWSLSDLKPFPEWALVVPAFDPLARIRIGLDVLKCLASVFGPALFSWDGSRFKVTSSTSDYSEDPADHKPGIHLPGVCFTGDGFPVDTTLAGGQPWGVGLNAQLLYFVAKCVTAGLPDGVARVSLSIPRKEHDPTFVLEGARDNLDPVQPFGIICPINTSA